MLLLYKFLCGNIGNWGQVFKDKETCKRENKQLQYYARELQKRHSSLRLTRKLEIEMLHQSHVSCCKSKELKLPTRITYTKASELI